MIHGKTTIEGEVHSVDISKRGSSITIKADKGIAISYTFPWYGSPNVFEHLPGCRVEITVTVFAEEEKL